MRARLGAWQTWPWWLGAALAVAQAALGQPQPAGRHAVWEASALEARTALERADLGQARSFLLTALGEAIRFPEHDVRTTRTVELLDALLLRLRSASGPAAVEEFLREADERAERSGAGAVWFGLELKARRALAAVDWGDAQRGEALARAALASAEQTLGPDHPLSMRLRGVRVRAVSHLDRRQGVELAERYLAEGRRRAGGGSPTVADALYVLAGAHRHAGWPERAIRPAEEAVAVQDRLFGKSSRTGMTARLGLAEIQAAAGRFAEAARTVEDARASSAAEAGSLERLRLEAMLTGIRTSLGELGAAKAALARARDAAALALPPGAPEHAFLLSLEAAVFEGEGRLDDAAERLERAIAFEEERGRGDARMVAGLRVSLADLESRRGNLEAAERLLRPLVAADSPERVLATAVLAATVARRGRPLEARPLVERARDLGTSTFGADNPGMAGVLARLGRAQLELGDLEPAQETLDRAFTLASLRPLPRGEELELWRSRALLAEKRGDDTRLERARTELARLASGEAASEPPRHTSREPAIAGGPGRLRSERFGYRVELEDGGWRGWPNQAAEFPTAETGALLRDHGAFVIVPVSLFGLEPDLDALRAGFSSVLAALDAESGRQVEHDGAEALAFEFERLVDGRSFRFRARVLRHDGVGMLLAAWALASLGAEAEDALAVLDRVRLSEAAPPEDPAALEPRERERHALVMNGIGIARLRGQQAGEALSFFERAAEIQPGHATILENVVYTLRELGRPDTALARLEAAASLVAERPELLATQALLRAELGQTQTALADYAAAFERGLRKPELELAYARLLAQSGEPERALAFLDERLTGGAPSPVLRRERARLRRLAGDGAAAQRELDELLAQNPGDVETLFELAETQAAAPDPAAVVRTCDRLLQLGAFPLAHFLKARAQIELGEPAAAKKSLEAALELQPEAQAARELLAHVSALLGQGNSAPLRTPLDPVAMPERIQRLLDEAPRPERVAEAPALVVSSVLGIRFEDGGELRSTSWWKIQVLDEQGVTEFSRFEFELDPLGEDFYVNSLVVRDAAGREVARGSSADAYVLHAPEGERVATSMQRVYLPVRGLAPGATIELVATQREKSPAERFRYRDHVFASRLPSGPSLVFVSGDVGELRIDASEGLRSERRDGWIAWWLERPPQDRWEPNQPLRRTDLPHLRLGDRRERWPALALDYLAEIREVLAPAPAAAEIARREIAGLEGSDDKARALARFVQRSLSYQAIAFGRRARMPKPAGEVLELRYGDCKDHALLLHQLLASVGIESRLALASFTTAVDPDVPSLDQFDHMIVRCFGCREARYFDATDKGLMPGRDVPRGLGGTSLLVLDPEQPRLETIPAPSDASHWAATERRIEVSESGGLAVEEEIEFGGYAAAWMRDFLRSNDRTQWKEAIRRALAHPVEVVEELDVASLDATELPLSLHLKYAVRDGFSKSSRGLVGRTPMPWEMQLLGIEPAADRISPFEFAFPMRFRGDVRIVGPAGYALLPPAQHGVQRDGRFTDVAGSIDAEERGLRMRYEIVRQGGGGPADAYVDAHREAQRAFEFLRQPFEVTPSR